MRKGWTETTLGDIAKCAGGTAFPHEFQGGDTGTPFVKVSDMNEPGNERYLISSNNYVSKEVIKSLGARVWPIGTIVFAKVGAALSTEKRRILVKDTIFDNNIMGLVPKASIESHFLYLFMETVKLGDYAQPGAVPSVNNSIVSEIAIKLPPITEQKRIVDVVSSVDGYINALQQQAGSARTARNALLHELIVLPSEHRKKIEDFVFLKRGHDLPSQSRVDGEYPVIASNGIVGWHNEKIGPIPGVITGRSGTIGKVVFEMGGYWPLNTTLYVTEFMGNDEKFAALTLETMQLDRFAGGTTVPSLDRKVLRSELVFAPPIEEQKRIVEIVSSMDDVIQSTEQAVTDAKNLRSGLLSDLLSGDHEIPASYDSLMGAA